MLYCSSCYAYTTPSLTWRPTLNSLIVDSAYRYVAGKRKLIGYLVHVEFPWDKTHIKIFLLRNQTTVHIGTARDICVFTLARTNRAKETRHGNLQNGNLLSRGIGVCFSEASIRVCHALNAPFACELNSTRTLSPCFLFRKDSNQGSIPREGAA